MGGTRENYMPARKYSDVKSSLIADTALKTTMKRKPSREDSKDKTGDDTMEEPMQLGQSEQLTTMKLNDAKKE